MSYRKYLIRRVLYGIPVLFGLSVVIFLISRVLPGDPVRFALGKGASNEQVQQVREQMGLNEPLPIQYVDWLIGIFRGDWGQSLRTNNNVLTDILTRLPATFELVLVTMTIAILVAIPLGIIAGTNKDKWEDHGSRIVALLGVSMPRFWIAILFQIFFVASLGIFPLTGRLSDGVSPPPAVTHLYLIDSLIAGQFDIFVNALWHIILPATALGLTTVAQVMRLLRSEIIEVSREDFVLAHKSYGVPNNLIEYKYMLKNAFSSSLTVIGLSFASLIGGAFLIELVFAWPGFARYAVNSMLYQDFNAMMGVVILVGTLFVISNMIIDILYGYLDPRIRYSGDES